MNEQSGPEQERGRSLQETERSHILAALKRNAWSQSRAAADLGISPRQMGYRVKKFGLKPVIAGAKADLRRKGKA
jgi:Nif-specific regulatory protein